MTDTARSLSTQLIHHPYVPPSDFQAVPPGVFKASTVFFKDVADLRQRQWTDKSGYTYGLHGTPTTFILEERIATLEGGTYCVLAPSGLSAIALVDLAFLRQGDELLLPDNAYGPNKTLAEGELTGWGITTRYYNPQDPAHLASLITPATRLVWLEAPGSVTLEFPDLLGLVAQVQAANAQRGADARPILTALDNTWGAGIAFNGFDVGADIVMQALTKYPSGGADVLMGSVVTRQHALHHALLMTHMRLGLGVGANDTELVLRGLSSIQLRYQAQDHATRTLAQWMQTRPEVAAVLHPALPDSPGHAHWQQVSSKGAGCLFSVVFDAQYDQNRVDAFCNALNLFHLGWSWAGPISLCAPYHIPSMRQLTWPHQGHLVRFAIGLESIPDLQADIMQALAVLRG